MRIVSEEEFRTRLHEALEALLICRTDELYVGSVTGPGRSGAVAAVYASHILGVPFIPYGAMQPPQLGRLLIIDTATESGSTLRKAASKYRRMDGREPITLAIYDEKDPEVGRVAFWYEAPKPQLYAHEATKTYRRQLQREQGLRNLP